APAATLAVALTVRMALPDSESPVFAGFLGFATLGAVFAAAGTTFFGAALPKDGLASLERSAIAGPAPAFDWVALPLAGAGLLAFCAIGWNPSSGRIAWGDNGLKVLRFPLKNPYNHAETPITRSAVRRRASTRSML